MASAELQRIIDLFQQRREQAAGQPAPDLAAMREGMESTAFPVADDVEVTPVDANGVPAEWIVAPGADPARRLLYLHGGGYVMGSINTHRDLAGRLSRAAGSAVLLIDYRLAPEHPFPAAVDDARAALAFLRANGPAGPGAAGAVFVAGDSAGGGLTLATLLATRDAGEPLPDAAATLSAWTDLAITGESIQTRAKVDPMITDTSGISAMVGQYAGGADPRDPLVSPLYADLAGLPPLLMQVGDAEVLLSDTTRVAERARQAGIDVTEEVWPEMFHVFQMFAGMLPEGQQAIDRIGEWVRSRVPAAAGD